MENIVSAFGRSGSKTRQRLALFSLCLAMLIAQLDTSVVNLAARPIGIYFKAGVSALQWVVDGYNLVYASFVLTGGLLADLKGRRLVLISGASLFSVASLLCAGAPNIFILIAGRALAGLGAAFLIPASLAIIRVMWPDPAERGRVLRIWASCNGLAVAIGPALGGILIQHFGWRSIFLLVVPLGLLAMVLARLVIPDSSDPQDRHFDGLAQWLGAATLGGLAFAAIQLHTAPDVALEAMIAAALTFAWFIRVERRRGAAALVPLDLFRIHQFRSAMIATTGMTFGMYGVLFLLPLTWQSVGRLGATFAGLALMPMALVFMLVSPFSEILTRRLGVRLITSGGVSIIGGGLLLIGLTSDRTSLLGAEIGLALTGLGMGLATGPLMGMAVGAVTAARAGTASALINVARMIGATLGIACLGALYGWAHCGQKGLCVAMICGGLVQILSVVLAFHRRDYARNIA